MKKIIMLISSVSLLAVMSSMNAEEAKKAEAAEPAKLEVTAAPEGAVAYIISPKDGDEVTSPVLVQFGLKGMGVAPAGVDHAKTGHHHLMIDMDKAPEAGMPMGGDVHHYGGGQTEAEIELKPGKHTLQLMLGDKLHVPFEPPVMSEKITITVK